MRIKILAVLFLLIITFISQVFALTEAERNFFIAVNKGDKEVVLDLLKKGIDVNAKDNNGFTALIGAVRWGGWGEGKKEYLKVLLENGADANAKDSYGMTALMWAVRRGKKEYLEFLLKNGADVNAKTNSGKTALMWAKAEGNTEVIQVLKKWIETHND